MASGITATEHIARELKLARDVVDHDVRLVVTELCATVEQQNRYISDCEQTIASLSKELALCQQELSQLRQSQARR